MWVRFHCVVLFIKLHFDAFQHMQLLFHILACKKCKYYNFIRIVIDDIPELVSPSKMKKMNLSTCMENCCLSVVSYIFGNCYLNCLDWICITVLLPLLFRIIHLYNNSSANLNSSIMIMIPIYVVWLSKYFTK